MSDRYFIEKGACPDCQGRLLPGDTTCAHCGRDLPPDIAIGEAKVRREINPTIVTVVLVVVGVLVYLAIAFGSGNTAILSVGSEAVLVPDEHGHMLLADVVVANEYLISENAGDEVGLQASAALSVPVKRKTVVLITQEEPNGAVGVRVKEGEFAGTKAFTTWDHLAPTSWKENEGDSE